VPRGMRAHGRAAWGPLGLDFPATGYVIEDDVVYLHAGRFGLHEPCAVVLSNDSFLTSDGRGGSELFAHGGLYPEEVLMPWLEFTRDRSPIELGFALEGRGVAGSQGELHLKVHNPSELAVRLVRLEIAINDAYFDLTETVDSMSSTELRLPWASWPTKRELQNLQVTLRYSVPSGEIQAVAGVPSLESEELYVKDDILGTLGVWMNFEVQRHDTEELARKVQEIFGKLVIDKQRLPMSQLQKRGIPAYVGEWVLDSLVSGTGPLSPEEARKVQAWAAKVIPGSGDQKVIKYRLSQGETVKVLTPVEVEIYLKRDRNERLALLKLLNLNEVNIADELLDRYPDLLRLGMWGVTELMNSSSGVSILDFRPMQASVNLDLYKKARHKFTVDEWRDLMLLSMGYNPQVFTDEERLALLTRLLPLVQKSMHLMELAPKGTGKSYIYENISPRVRLISGGNVSPAVLFVNNASGQWGLLARSAVVVLDEVQTLKFQKPEEIVGGLKGFLANGRLTRGGLYETASDTALVLLANVALDERQQPISSPLINELPGFLQETAFLDRLRGIIPGWKVRKLGGSSFATSVGVKTDFFGDALLALRDDLYADQYCARRISLLGDRLYRRNEEAIRTISSGMMKILFPHGEVSNPDFRRYCVEPAVELRQLVWEQLYMLDAEYRQYEEWLGYELLDEQSALDTVEDVSSRDRRPAALYARSTATTGLKTPSVRELIDRGESRTVEFKSSARWNLHKGDKDPAIEREILKTVAGFMNADGGTLLIGVSDNRQPVGLRNDYKLTKKGNRDPRDSFENWLTDLLDTSIGRPALANVIVSFEDVDRHDVCRVEVKPARQPAYVRRDKQTMDFYVRFNNGTRLLTVEDAVTYIRDHEWKGSG
jgi:ATP-dependent Lon protease